jgi:cardiolipin synthase (CMP-forming)
MPRWLNLANFFTFLRLLLTPVIVWAILVNRHPLALALFFAAAVTDILDGFAARRLDRSTQVGAYFDPIADKCLLSGVFLALAASRIAPWWLVGIVLGRDFYILLGAGIFMAATPIRKFPPSVWGKASTFVQIGAVVVWLTRGVFPGPVLNGIAAGVLWLCAAATVWSGLNYTWRGILLARASPGWKKTGSIDAPQPRE